MFQHRPTVYGAKAQRVARKWTYATRLKGPESFARQFRCRRPTAGASGTTCWCNDRCDLAQGRSAQPVRTYGEGSAIVVTQPKPTSPELLSKNTILFNQIGERFPLPAIQPAYDGVE